MTARKRKVRRAAGAGRPPKAPETARTVKRAVLLMPSEAEAHDAARGDADWSDWIRDAASERIARTRELS